MGDTERRPLLDDGDGDQSSSSPPPAYSELDETANSSRNKQLGASASGELPPPYTPTAPSTHINCKVCQNPISLEGRQNLHVIKCQICSEATPIKNAPPGKKYVRCPCNCLLICNSDALRIACPRENCRRIIVLQQYTTCAPIITASSLRAQCAYCNDIFVIQRAVAASRLARCAHCRRISFVGPDLRNRKLAIFGIIGLLFLLAGIITTVVSYELASESAGIYIVWIGAFVVGLLNIMRAIYWACVKVSKVVP